MKTPLPDPFAGDPDATRADFPVLSRARRQEAPCDVSSKPKRRKMDFNPLERRRFERLGYTYQRVEHKSAWTGRVHDLWTWGDWLAIRGDETLIVQTCHHSDAAKREKKARATPELALWLKGAHRRFEIHGWRQPGGAGTAWECVVRTVALTDAETPGEWRDEE